MRETVLVTLLVLTLAVGGAGGYLFANRSATTATQQRDSLATENATLKTKVSTLETQVKNLNTESGQTNKQLEKVSTEAKQLREAVQITTVPRDVALAYGRARLQQNDSWIRALFVPAEAESYQPRPLVPGQAPVRFSVAQESRVKDTWVYTVRVWEAATGQGEVGYFDSVLEVVKAGDYYQIRSLKMTDHFRLQGNK